MERIGFIGIGLMGRHMARHLMEAGHALSIWNRSAEKARELCAAGAVWAESPKALAEASDVVITMVTDSAASEAVICGPDGVLEGAHPGLTLIDMGSIAPEMSRSIAARAKALVAGVGESLFSAQQRIWPPPARCPTAHAPTFGSE